MITDLPTNKAYLSAITVTNISKSFTYKMAAKISSHRYGTKLSLSPWRSYRDLRFCDVTSRYAEAIHKVK